VLVALLAAAAAVVPASGTYTGRTSEHEPVRLVVRAGVVVRADATVANYRCEPEGEIGGRRVVRAVAAPFSGGRFRFDAGPMPEFLKMTGRAGPKRTITGRLRVHGTIGTGDPCTSRTVRYSVTLKR
jgi:hypothetical protein